MFTSDKAISEMSRHELDEEYRYCINAAEESTDREIKRYFRDRAAVVKRHLEDSRVFDN